jgi:hypothetical protein
MNSLQPHKQVPCKVTRYVDEGIKELVELLNTFDNVSTIESCQGDQESGEDAFVDIQYGRMSGNGYKASAAFAKKLKKALIEDKFDPSIPTVSLEWLGSHTVPDVVIKIPPKEIKTVVRLLSEKRSVFSHDTACR